MFNLLNPKIKFYLYKLLKMERSSTRQEKLRKPAFSKNSYTNLIHWSQKKINKVFGVNKIPTAVDLERQDLTSNSTENVIYIIR